MTDSFLRKNLEKKNETQLKYILENPDQFTLQEVRVAKEILYQKYDSTFGAENFETKDSTKIPSSFYETPIKPRYSLRAIALYQLLTSIFAIPQFFSVSAELTLLQTAILFFFILLYSATLISAILIYTKKQIGLLIGLVVNIIQAIQIHAAGLIFYATGFTYIYLSIGGYIGFSVGITPSSLIVVGAVTVPAYIGVNIISIIATALLYKASRYCDKKEEFPLHLF